MNEILNEFTGEFEDTQHSRFLTFALGEEDFGIEIRYVTEIIGMQPITKIPEVPEYIKGIINLRGKITPLIDVRIKFKKEPIAYTDRTSIIVVDTGEISVGLIVDKVADVISIDDGDIVPPPDIRTGIQNRYIQCVGKVGSKVKLLLDCERLFDEDETQQIGGLE